MLINPCEFWQGEGCIAKVYSYKCEFATKEFVPQCIAKDDDWIMILMKIDFVPKCQTCGAKMVNAIDNKTGRKNKYLWKTTCSHNANIILSKG